MKRKVPVFRGIATALITPMTSTGIDFDSFARLIDWQISEGINALVIAGTTGEGSTLSDEEHRAVVEFSVKRAAGRVPVIAGTGSNDTAYAIELTKHCCDVGADAMLVVTPYYNKATQNGLIRSFNAIADASTKPVILYNVPSRTGCNIEPATYVELAKHERIVAVKEASGNIGKIVETAALAGDVLDIYSGNDDQIVPIMSMGGIGCISVLSNLLPRQSREITDLFFGGDIKGSAAAQCRYLQLINALFCEVNPIPVKAALNAMGFCSDEIRLPLTQIEDSHKTLLLQRMKEVGIIA